MFASIKKRLRVVKKRISWLFACDEIKAEKKMYSIDVDKIRNIDDVKDIMCVCVREINLTYKQACKLKNKSLLKNEIKR